MFLLLPGLWFLETCLAGEAGEGYVTSADGVQIFYRVVGQGEETLVVIHGGPGNTMESILPDLEPLKNYRIIYYDQRGCGRSSLITEGKRLTIQRHIEDLEAIRQFFNIEKLNIIGNSWGGLLASYYAIAHPENVNRLVMLSPASPSISLLRQSAPHIHQRIPLSMRGRLQRISVPEMWMRAEDPRKICQEFYDIIWPVYFPDLSKAIPMRGNVCGGPVDALRLQLLVNKLTWEALGDWNIIPELKNLKNPTLIIHGRFDMIPIGSSHAWAEAIPQSRLLVIEDSGHMTHVEQPEIFFSAVNTFFNGEWPAEAIDVKEKDTPLNKEFPVPGGEDAEDEGLPQSPNLPMT